MWETRTEGQGERDKASDGLPWAPSLATRGVGGQEAGAQAEAGGEQGGEGPGGRARAGGVRGAAPSCAGRGPGGSKSGQVAGGGS